MAEAKQYTAIDRKRRCGNEGRRYVKYWEWQAPKEDLRTMRLINFGLPTSVTDFIRDARRIDRTVYNLSSALISQGYVWDHKNRSWVDPITRHKLDERFVIFHDSKWPTSSAKSYLGFYDPKTYAEKALAELDWTIRVTKTDREAAQLAARPFKQLKRISHIGFFFRRLGFGIRLIATLAKRFHDGRKQLLIRRRHGADREGLLRDVWTFPEHNSVLSIPRGYSRLLFRRIQWAIQLSRMRSERYFREVRRCKLGS